MSNFAKVENGIVTRLISAEQDYIDSGAVGDPSLWVRTSFNTRGGVWYSPETGEADQSKAFRKNYAGVGWTYDAERDAFISPKPFKAWVLNEESCMWEAPIPYPENTDIEYMWSDEENNWVPTLEGSLNINVNQSP